MGEDGEEIDLDDQINAPDTNSSEPPTPSSSTYLTIKAQDGTEKRVHKARALKVLFQEIVNEKGSTDRQKRIQGLTRYSIKPTNTLDSPGSNDSIFSKSICVGDPAITLVVVEQLAFLAIIQLSSIKLGMADIQHAPISILPEDNIIVGFHILMLKSTMIHEGNEDWIWANRGLEQTAGRVKGKYIQPISPTVWVDGEMKQATFIFSKTELQELTAALITSVGRQGLP